MVLVRNLRFLTKSLRLVMAASICILPVQATDNAPLATGVEPPDITILYEDYPPYFFLQDGELKGLFAERTRRVFEMAGTRFGWQVSSYSRLVRRVSTDGKQVCAAGYSTDHLRVPGIWVSKPVLTVAANGLAIKRSDLQLFEQHATIAEIVADKKLRGGLLRDVYYYGLSDALGEAPDARHVFVSGTDQQLALMVASGRIHFAPMNPDQTAYIRQTVAAAGSLVAYRPHGMRGPASRHIICSQSVPASVRARLNAAISALYPDVPETVADSSLVRR